MEGMIMDEDRISFREYCRRHGWGYPIPELGTSDAERWIAARHLGQMADRLAKGTIFEAPEPYRRPPVPAGDQDRKSSKSV